MIIPCIGSAEEVCARLELNAREWRESRLPDALRQLGVWSYELQPRGPQRYALSIAPPHRNFFSYGSAVEVTSDGDGTVIRFEPVLVPPVLHAGLAYSGLICAVLLGSVFWGERPSAGSLLIAVVAGFGLAGFTSFVAIAGLPPYAAAMRAILEQAARPADSRGPA